MQTPSNNREALHDVPPPFEHSSPLAATIRKKLLQKRKDLRLSLEPELSARTKQLIKYKYNRVLEKVEMARNELERKGIAMTNTDEQSFLKNKEQVVKFYEVLTTHLHDIIPEILSQMADKLSKNLVIASKDNIIAKAITLYPSIMGSYNYRPTVKQILTPTVRTLHHLQQQILDNYSQTRGSEGSLWVLMYLVFAVFVHLFGKYITRPQKAVVGYILKQAFVLHIIYMSTSLEIPEVSEQKLDDLLSKWFKELKDLMSAKMPSL